MINPLNLNSLDNLSQDELQEVISMLRKAAANDDDASSEIVATTKDMELSLNR